MSYILEALKKAEQARLATKLPDRQSLVLSSDDPVRQRFAWISGAMLIIALAAVVIAAGIGWWFSDKARENQLPEKVAVMPPTSLIGAGTTREAMAIPHAPTVNAAVAERLAEGSHDNVGTGVLSTRTTEKVITPLLVAHALTSSQSVADKKLHALVERTDKSARIEALPGHKPAARLPGSASLASGAEAGPEPKRADKGSATTADLKPSRDSRVLHIEGLPPEVRRDVPKISATGYVYSADTGVRVVNVNERSLQEGDELMAGLKLEQIAPDHVLFSFRGYRFRIEMF
jgi:general secretion pathway protein B